MQQAFKAPFSRFLQASAGVLLATSLAACAPESSTRDGQIDFALAATDAPSHCDADGTLPGSVVLASLDGVAQAEVSGAELTSGASVRRHLPGGIYTLSFRPAPFDDDDDEPAPMSWKVQSPSLTTVLAGQTTRLRLKREARSCLELSSRD